MTGHPKGYCATKARVNLNAQQWADMASSDKAKAEHSAKRAQRFQRQLAIHLAACPVCSNLPAQRNRGECECGPIWTTEAIGAQCDHCEGVILEWVP